MKKTILKDRYHILQIILKAKQSLVLEVLEFQVKLHVFQKSPKFIKHIN